MRGCRAPFFLQCPALGLLIATLFAGCQSLDPSGDLARAEYLAQSRHEAIASEAAMPSWRGDGPLSRELAIEIALQRAPEAIAIRPAIATARAALAEASLPPNPSFRWLVGVPVDPAEALPLFLGLAQDLGYLLQRDALIEVAQLGLESEVVAAAQVLVEIAHRIERLHREVALAEALEVVARDRETVTASQFALARDREAVGEGTPSETALAKAALQAIVATRAEADRVVRRAKLALLLAMGRPGLSLDWNTTLPNQPDLILIEQVSSALRAAPDSESALLTIAFANRLDLLAADLSACSRFEAMGVAARSIWDSLSIGVAFDRDMEGMRGVPFSGSIPIPIFDDGSVPRARAEAAWQRSMIDRFALAQTIEAEVRGAWIDRSAAAEMLAARVEELERVEAALATQRDAYEGGFASLESVLALEVRRLDSIESTVEAEAAVALGDIELRRAIGGVAGSSVEVAEDAVAREVRALPESNS